MSRDLAVHINFPIPANKAFDVVGVGINVVDYLFRMPHFPEPDTKIDASGAGDVFHGAFAFGVLQGWEARDILTFANAVSAMKCTRLSGRSGIPGAGEAQAFLRARGVLIPSATPEKETRR